MPNVRKKKKFIDRKNAVSFNLVHRSQQDPLLADDDAPKHVLVEADRNNDIGDRKKEQQKYGVYYDDDYDYLQHLRDVRELCQSEPMEVSRSSREEASQSKPLVLPSSVFASEVQTKEGLINKGACLQGPQPDWDPDVVAALDDDFDHEDPDNLLEDDFVLKAMDDDYDIAEGNDSEGDGNDNDEEWVTTDEEDDDEVEINQGKQLSAFKAALEQKSREMRACDYDSDDLQSEPDDFDGYDSFDEGAKTAKFTEYSMTSSVCPRSEALTLVDDRFEHMMVEYDEFDVGALDQDEIEGHRDDSKMLLDAVLQQYEKKKESDRSDLSAFVRHDLVDRAAAQRLHEQDSKQIELEFEETSTKPQWDCESILSTYSTCYNHPTLIQEAKKVRPSQASRSSIKPIQLTKRLAIPDDVLPNRGPTVKQREKTEDCVLIEKAPTIRSKTEDTDEKRARKSAVKTERRLRREAKKNNQNLYKEEEQKQKKDLRNVQQALKGVHMD